jgi:hypothetical protein
MEAKTREQRIFDAEAKVKGIKLVMKPLEKLLDEAERELRKAKGLFEIGDKVYTEETCQRGCCTEWESNAVVVRVVSDEEYVLKDNKSGEEFARYGYKMKRIDNDQTQA